MVKNSQVNVTSTGGAVGDNRMSSNSMTIIPNEFDVPEVYIRFDPTLPLKSSYIPQDSVRLEGSLFFGICSTPPI